MSPEMNSDFAKAGQIAGIALQYGKTLIRRDAVIAEVLDKIEASIRELGGEIAFPAQVALNETAAHFCPEDYDATFGDDLVSLDIGAHVNGYVGDTALTVDLSGRYGDLMKASRNALAAAVKAVGLGAKIGDIGAAIESEIEGFGYKPVQNLSGHGLGKYQIHTSPSIPNVDNGDRAELTEGMTIAVEPFATDGIGMVGEKGDPSIFMLTGNKPVRVGFVRDIRKEIDSLHGLPFTTRWLTRRFGEAKVQYAFNQFRQLGILHDFPPLVEKQGGMVSQAEHSFYIGEKTLITTKVDKG